MMFENITKWKNATKFPLYCGSHLNTHPVYKWCNTPNIIDYLIVLEKKEFDKKLYKLNESTTENDEYIAMVKDLQKYCYRFCDPCMYYYGYIHAVTYRRSDRVSPIKNGEKDLQFFVKKTVLHRY